MRLARHDNMQRILHGSYGEPVGRVQSGLGGDERPRANAGIGLPGKDDGLDSGNQKQQ